MKIRHGEKSETLNLEYEQRDEDAEGIELSSDSNDEQKELS